jgi:hypothetical protein
MPQSAGPYEWMSRLPEGGSTIKRKRLGIFFIFWWGIWKERNRRVFEAREILASRIASKIIGDVRQFDLAGLL